MAKKINRTHSEDFYIGKLPHDFLLKEVMAQPVISINNNDDFSLVQERPGAHQVRHLSVIDNNQTLLKIVTSHDMLKITDQIYTEYFKNKEVQTKDGQ